MDKIDKKILELLQENSQISNQELADKIALSPSPCARRVKQLEQNNYIKKYVARLNPDKLNLQLTIIVMVGLNQHDAETMAHFENKIKNFPEVIQCLLLAGQASDYLLKVMVPSLDHYQSFLLKNLMSIKGVSNVHSSFVLKNILDRNSLPLDYL